MQQIESDVVIVGYGPVSRMLSVILGKQGHSVTVIERHPGAYPLPRAVCMDHEIYRALQAHECGDSFATFGAPSPRYQWMNYEWKTLLDIDWTIDSISGGPEAYFFYQPSLEAALDQKVRAFSSVNVLLQHEAKSFTHSENGVVVEAINIETGCIVELHGKYLIGADGANSIVRNSLGIAWNDRGFQADWLVVDVLLNEGVVLDIPSAGQYCNPERPTTFVPGGIKDGRPLRRWEIMRLPQESRECLENTEYVWCLLERWVKRDQAQLVRHAVYTFSSLVAESWSQGRVYLVGDAAHTMPPFMGQGMCSGMRDVLNLGWRLDLVLKGLCDTALLNDYEVERKPHITEVIDTSVYLGEIVCVADAQLAAKRDQAFFNGTFPPMAAFPHIKQGTLGSVESDWVGRLAPHAEILNRGKRGRMDTLLGTGFTLLLKNVDAYAGLSDAELALLKLVDARCVYLSDLHDSSFSAIHDFTGKISRFFADTGFSSLLVRPDFYVFGAAKDALELSTLLSQLHCALKVRAPSPLDINLQCRTRAAT
ncbi:bifunctional 3-(3-hydroxy-phenyl)propionate/3-hydroxycinnamic acid hydroxylase [Pseudomonas sp. MAFF 301449]|uniref:Bifunctional 3-(3-hydroxy-phenyl)propionate/3-hydroxycinnamic acid hydroxylase n=1 Tax=Pseudomonas cyclaminis TaxID=2781239 RepID=A0ABR9SSQ3_9PSED|nr:bifunctional 3-(3-hydroxy-phenyl)propionate/3-hydroxycinnamic acid hydroxylase [Pseudomonas cyclaminis]MBE8591941.1 bifunctional 3-(3-hydroxy-phenyl)propionate/3-hydroxycinnamic acid hydroxylase [Pseudomonas cyclaminis]MBE8600138.1 bifunctional 3-(3-hydroxy-phenyl)propionate/3-hydroxycinnamic acid hydroxylase [Pseudomonas cyclaminis]